MFNSLNLIIVKAILMLINERIFNKENKFLSQNILYLIDFIIRLKKNYIVVVVNLLPKSLLPRNKKNS